MRLVQLQLGRIASLDALLGHLRLLLENIHLLLPQIGLRLLALPCEPQLQQGARGFMARVAECVLGARDTGCTDVFINAYLVVQAQRTFQRDIPFLQVFSGAGDIALPRASAQVELVAAAVPFALIGEFHFQLAGSIQRRQVAVQRAFHLRW